MGWVFNVVDEGVVTNAPTLAIVGVVFTIFSLTVVSLRMYVRWRIVKRVSIGQSSWWEFELRCISNSSLQMTGLSLSLGYVFLELTEVH